MCIGSTVLALKHCHLSRICIESSLISRSFDGVVHALQLRILYVIPIWIYYERHAQIFRLSAGWLCMSESDSRRQYELISDLLRFYALSAEFGLNISIVNLNALIIQFSFIRFKLVYKTLLLTPHWRAIQHLFAKRLF